MRNLLPKPNLVKNGYLDVHAKECYNLAGKKTKAPV